MDTNLNIAQLIRQYLAESDFMPSTLRTYRYSLQYFWRYCSVNSIDMRHPQRADIIAWKRSLKEKGLATPTIDLYIVGMKGFFRWLEESGIYKNITTNIKIETRHRFFKKKILTADQVKKVLSDISTTTLIGMRDKAMIQLMYTNGLRRIEIQRLNLSDLDIQDQTILIQGKGHNDKLIVGINPNVSELLEQYIQMRVDSGEDVESISPMFVSYASNHYFPVRLNPDSISLIIQQHMKISGIYQSGMSAHSLRHSAAVSLIENGSTLYDVSIFLRHSSTDISRHYTRYIEAKKATEKRPQNLLQQGIN